MLVNEDSIIAYSNGLTAAVFGYTKEELIGQHINVLIPEDVREKHKEYVKKYMMDPYARNFDAPLALRGIKKDGNEIELDIMLIPIQFHDIKLIAVIVRNESSIKGLSQRLNTLMQKLDKIV